MPSRNGNGDHHAPAGELPGEQWELIQRWFAELNLKQDKFLTRFDNSVAAFRAELKVIAPRIDTLVGEVARVSERVDVLAELVHNNNNQTVRLVDAVNELRQAENLFPLTEAVTELRNVRAVMERALDTMRDEVTGIKQTI